MSDATTATAMIEARDERARESYRNDARFRSIVQAVVDRALRVYGPIDPHSADRVVCDIAIKATSILLQAVYEGDAELSAQKALAERYRKIAEDAVAFSPRAPMFIRNPTP